MTLAIDMSKWGGDYTAEEAACAVQEGYLTAVLATGPGGYSQNVKIQADDVVAAGQALEVYSFLEWGYDPVAWIEQGHEALGPFVQHVKRFWLDVEDTDGIIIAGSLSDRVAYIRRAMETVRRVYGVDVPAGIYTGRWYWTDPRYMANSPAFGAYPLWNSYYDDDPDIDGLPYGGWTRESVAIEQFQGTTIVCGQSVDKNWVYKPAQEAPIMADAEQEDIIIATFGGGGEQVLPRERRLANARYRMAKVITGEDGAYDAPLAERIGSHIATHPTSATETTLRPFVAQVVPLSADGQPLGGSV